MISIFIVCFDLYGHVLATSLEKRKTNFPRLYSWSSLCCHYGISNIFLHHENVLPRNPEISVRWFLLKSVLKQMWAQGWQGKRKQMGSILLRYQPSVTCNFRTALKTSYDFYWNCEQMEVEGRSSVSLCQIYFPIVIWATHTNFKMFSQWTICSVASDYDENNEVKDFFRLGCLSDSRKLPWIWVASSKTPMVEFIF